MLPIVNTLRSRSPMLDITWIINKTEYELVKNMPNIDFIVVDKSKMLKSIIRLLKLRSQHKFDVLLHMQISLRANILSLLINCSRKIGFNKNFSKDFHSLLNHETIQCSNKIHVLESFFCFLDQLGIKEKLLDWTIPLDTDQEFTHLYESQYIVINPFTSNRRLNYREWDLKNYKFISKYVFSNYNLKTVIVGGKSNYEVEKSKIFDESHIINLVGKTNLHQLCNIIKKCKFYIGPDSGTLHIASMMGKNVVGLYVTSNPDRTGPFNNMNHIINKYPLALMKYKNKEISNAKWGERIREKDAMSLITIDEVGEMIDRIMN